MQHKMTRCRHHKRSTEYFRSKYSLCRYGTACDKLRAGLPFNVTSEGAPSSHVIFMLDPRCRDGLAWALATLPQGSFHAT